MPRPSEEPSRLQQAVSFYRECYEADNRELGLWNVFRDKHWHLHFMAGKEEIVTEAMPRVPIDGDLAEAAVKSQKMYQRERSLLYTSCYIAGNVREAGRKRVICAPLLYYGARLESDGGDWFLRIDASEENLNVPLLRWLRDRADIEATDLALLPDLDSETFGRAGPGMIAPWLRTISPDIDCLGLFKFPELTKSDALRQVAENGPVDSLSVHAASAMVLVAKSPNTRGVLHELAHTVQAEASRTVLADMLGDGSSIVGTAMPSNPDEVPGLLNGAQEKALASAADNSVSLIIGPPGTGKSYTIAAIAIDRLAHGESVLIVSNTEQAVDVVGQKISDNLSVSDCVVRAGRGDYLREFKRYVDDLLHGIGDPELEAGHARELAGTAHALGRQLKRLEGKVNRRLARSLSWGKALSHDLDKSGFLRNTWRRFIEYRVLRSLHPWELIEKIQELRAQRENVVSDLIDARHLAQRWAELNANRSTFVSFSKGIRARASSRQKAMFDSIDFRVLLKAFPIWLCSLDALHKVLPLRPGIFDLLIIDEATQCNIATCLPALYRARRVVVVGDPKQLRHVSFLSRTREKRAVENNCSSETAEALLSYRDNSILDLVNQTVASQENVVFLDEHYRGKPDLIGFSNKHFYQSALRIMSERPDHDATKALEIVSVEGRRNKRGINGQEADAVLEKIAVLVEKAAESGLNVAPSIGVLSPFREQAAHLERAIRKRFSLEIIERHGLRAGTAYAFQGEERDIMLLSFTVDGDTGASALTYLNRPDVFNVSITRARERSYLFCSVEPDSLKAGSLFRSYLEFVRDGASEARPRTSDLSFDAFQEEVCEWLLATGISIWKGYTVAGFQMDIVRRQGAQTLAIDLIGFPGELADFHRLERFCLFQRAGLQVYPLTYGSWRLADDRCKAEILGLLEREALPNQPSVGA